LSVATVAALASLAEPRNRINKALAPASRRKELGVSHSELGFIGEVLLLECSANACVFSPWREKAPKTKLSLK
jgi:hypothetical protein